MERVSVSLGYNPCNVLASLCSELYSLTTRALLTIASESTLRCIQPRINTVHAIGILGWAPQTHLPDELSRLERPVYISYPG